MSDDDGYLIWSNMHGYWWQAGKPVDSPGHYTSGLGDAAVYTRDTAMAICQETACGKPPDAPPPNIPVRRADAIDAFTKPGHGQDGSRQGPAKIFHLKSIRSPQLGPARR